MPKLDAKGLEWADQIPLLEQLTSTLGHAGGVAGLDYCYCPITALHTFLREEQPATHPHSGDPLTPDEQARWRWRPAAPDIFRITNTVAGLSCDFQILERGIPVRALNPGAYRVPCFIHPSMQEELGYGDADWRRLTVDPNYKAEPTAPAPKPTQRDNSATPTAQRQAAA